MRDIKVLEDGRREITVYLFGPKKNITLVPEMTQKLPSTLAKGHHVVATFHSPGLSEVVDVYISGPYEKHNAKLMARSQLGNDTTEDREDIPVQFHQ